MSSSMSEGFFLILVQISIVKMVEDELKMDVRELLFFENRLILDIHKTSCIAQVQKYLINAANMTEIISPVKPNYDYLIRCI